MGICRRLCSHGECRVIKYYRETSVGFIVIHYLPLFDLCLSNALLLPVVILVINYRIFIPGFILSSRSCEMIHICKLFFLTAERRFLRLFYIVHEHYSFLHTAPSVASKLTLTPHISHTNLKLEPDRYIGIKSAIHRRTGIGIYVC